MIERKFIKQNLTEYSIKEFVRKQLSRAGLSDVKLMRTPLGEKIVVYASRPGLVVGRGGDNISQITRDLKREFGLENPQIEIEEVLDPNLDPNIVAEMIANTLERFGPSRFKGTGYKALQDVMNAKARGVEIIISGKIPSARAKNWRFYAGYLKKCGDTALTGVDTAFSVAKIKAGAVGIKVSIMPPTTKLPDDIEIKDEIGVEEIKDETEVVKEVKKKAKAVEDKKEKPKEAKKAKPAEGSEEKKEVKKESKTKKKPKAKKEAKPKTKTETKKTTKKEAKK